MVKRLIYWFTYNVVFALLPLIAMLLMRSLTGKLSSDAVATSEVLFFALMVSAVAGGDIKDCVTDRKRNDTFRILESSLLIGAFLSAILYGAFVYDNVAEQHSSVFQARLPIVSITLASVLFVLSTLTEMLLGKLESKRRA